MIRTNDLEKMALMNIKIVAEMFGLNYLEMKHTGFSGFWTVSSRTPYFIENY